MGSTFKKLHHSSGTIDCVFDEIVAEELEKESIAASSFLSRS